MMGSSRLKPGAGLRPHDSRSPFPSGPGTPRPVVPQGFRRGVGRGETAQQPPFLSHGVGTAETSAVSVSVVTGVPPTVTPDGPDRGSALTSPPVLPRSAARRPPVRCSVQWSPAVRWGSSGSA